MKKQMIMAGLLCVLAPALCRAQGQTYTVAQVQDESNKKMTGNKEDVLTNYLQVAANNITSTNQNFTLKLNWFALNFMDSARKYNDVNYQNTRWQRNGQLILAGGMDKNQHFNSLAAGVSYNVLNLRDTTEFHYFSYYQQALTHLAAIRTRETKVFIPDIAKVLQAAIETVMLDQFEKKEKDQLKAGIYNAIKSFPSDGNTAFLINKAQDALNKGIDAGDKQTTLAGAADLGKYGASYMLDYALNKYVTSFGKQSLSFDTYVDAAMVKKITDAIDKEVVADPLLQTEYKAKGLTDADQQIAAKYKDLVSYIARQPLVTAAINGNYGQGTTPSYIGAGFSGVWGLNKLGSKKTNQLTAALSDTLTEHNADKVRSLNRNLVAAQGGLNTVLAMSKNVSVMELNVGIEDDLQFGPIGTGETKNKFTFNSTYRVRLPGSPWLKLTLKYDPKSANVLGLLNFTYDLDNSSSSKK